MSDGKPEIKDLSVGISRTPDHVQVEGKTVPVLEAVQDVKNQTVNMYPHCQRVLFTSCHITLYGITSP